MSLLLKVASYLFHPIFIPLVGSFFYFYITPRFFPEPIVKAKLLAVCIITIFIPIVFFYLLKTLGLVKSIFLKTAKERLFPLILFVALINFLVLQIIFDVVNFQELHYFYVGILFSSLTCLLMAIANLKVSLHMVSIAGLSMFIIALSVHFKINMIFLIAFLVAANGLVATSRYKANAHTGAELILGFIIGLLPQLYTLRYWL